MRQLLTSSRQTGEGLRLPQRGDSGPPCMVCVSWRHQHWSAFVLHEEHDEFRRFGLACVPPNDVDIIRAF